VISAERLRPQPGIIEPLSNSSVLVPHPADLEEDQLIGILAESIFLTTEKVRIKAAYKNFVEQISPEEIDDVRTKYKTEDTYFYILEKAHLLSYADEFIIETLK
jgi:hypothetical protein